MTIVVRENSDCRSVSCESRPVQTPNINSRTDSIQHHRGSMGVKGELYIRHGCSNRMERTLQTKLHQTPRSSGSHGRLSPLQISHAVQTKGEILSTSLTVPGSSTASFLLNEWTVVVFRVPRSSYSQRVKCGVPYWLYHGSSTSEPAVFPDFQPFSDLHPMRDQSLLQAITP